MAIPDYQSIMPPLLELAGDDQIHRVHDAVDLLAQQFKLTAEEWREVIPSGRVSRFHNNVTWARTYLKKAGLLEDPKRGEFRITERGRQVIAGGHGSIGVRFLEQFDEFRKFKTARRAPRPDASAKLDLPEETPEEALQVAYPRPFAGRPTAETRSLLKVWRMTFWDGEFECLQKPHSATIWLESSTYWVRATSSMNKVSYP